VYKDNASKIIELGYISEIEIRNKINDLLIDKNNKTNPHELYSLGLCYTPMEILNGLEIKNVEENRYKAIQYLLELINRNTDQNIICSEMKLMIS
jgi:hypothetical protein